MSTARLVCNDFGLGVAHDIWISHIAARFLKRDPRTLRALACVNWACSEGITDKMKRLADLRSGRKRLVHVPRGLWNEETYFAAVESAPICFRDIPAQHLTPTLCCHAVRHYPENLLDVPRKYWTSNFFFGALGDDSDDEDVHDHRRLMIKRIPDKMWTRSLRLLAFSRRYIQDIGKEGSVDPDRFYHDAVTRNPACFVNVPRAHRSDALFRDALFGTRDENVRQVIVSHFPIARLHDYPSHLMELLVQRAECAQQRLPFSVLMFIASDERHADLRKRIEKLQ